MRFVSVTTFNDAYLTANINDIATPLPPPPPDVVVEEASLIMDELLSVL